MFRIIENALTSSIAREKSVGEVLTSLWFNLPVKREYQKQILEYVKDYVPIDNAVGIEEWGHVPETLPFPQKHLDKDEELYKSTGELKFPLCSCIYYHKIENLVGADLMVETHKITPESNMLVLLKPGIWHEITQYTSGTRTAVMINVWDYRLAKNNS
jgi:hypothetical protein